MSTKTSVGSARRPVGEQAARAGEAALGEVIADKAVIRRQQRPEDEADDERRDRDGNEDQREADAVEAVVAPQRERDGEAEQELERRPRATVKIGGVDEAPDA